MIGYIKNLSLLTPFFRSGAIYIVMLFCSLTFTSLSSGASDDTARLNSEIPPARVLVVHSSHKGYFWTDMIDRGIVETFGVAPEAVEISTEYLDTKKFSDPLYFEKIFQLWQTKFAGNPFDVVVTSDNDALNFVVRHRVALFEETPVVFSGLNNFDPAMLSGQRAITGVVEEDDFAATIDLALMLHPQSREIVVVVPGRDAFRMKLVEDLPAIYGSRVAISYLDDRLMLDMERQVEALSPDVIVVPIASAQTTSGEYIGYPEFVDRLSRLSKAPIYAVWDLALGHGIVGGKLTSGLAQGQTAAALALEIIRGQNLDQLPVVTDSPNRYMFDYVQMQRFGIQESDLPADSVVINQPPSFYSQYAVLIWSVFAMIPALGVGAVLLGVIVRRQTARLKRSEQRFKDFAEFASDWLWESDEDFRLTYISAGATRLTGLPEMWFLGKSRDDIASADPISDDMAQQLEDMENQQSFRGLVHSVPTADAGKIWVSISGTPRLDAAGGFVGYRGAVSDITRQTQAEDALKDHLDLLEHKVEDRTAELESANQRLRREIEERKNAELAAKEREARLSSILNTARDAIVSIDDQGLIETFNDAAERIFGYLASEVIGKNVNMLMPSPDREKHDGYLTHYQTTGERKVIGIGREVEARRKDGTLFPIDLAIGEIVLRGRTYFTGVIRDITERRETLARADQLRQELAHVSRVVEIAELTSDLAHEVNQPLGAVKNYVEASRDLLAARAIPEMEQILDLMDKAVGQADRAAGIIRRLRRFIARGDIVRSLEQVNGIVEETCELADLTTQRHKISIRLALGSDLPLVSVDRVQIQQVVLNLIRNAIDAHGDQDGREIIISTSHNDAGHLEVAVSDNGPGIAVDVVERLFEPYVTTKAKGMGIGLSISRSIVEAHGGRIWAGASPTGGAVFRFTLPLTGAGQEK